MQVGHKEAGGHLVALESHDAVEAVARARLLVALLRVALDGRAHVAAAWPTAEQVVALESVEAVRALATAVRLSERLAVALA